MPLGYLDHEVGRDDQCGHGDARPVEVKVVVPALEVRELHDARGFRMVSCAMIPLGYGLGLRVSEVARLCVRDMDSESIRLLVEDGNGLTYYWTVLLCFVRCLCLPRTFLLTNANRSWRVSASRAIR